MRQLDSVLAEHPFFAGLGDDFARLVAGCGRQVRFEKGDYLYRQGDPADAFYIIRRGSIGLEMRGPRGPVVFDTEHPGGVINAAWIVPPYRCGTDARALETSICVALDAGCLRGKCEADHDLGYELMKRFVPVLVERLTNARYQSLDVYGTGKTA
jgi:CRP/FNR family transcriptional regulator, cyclic AMP receptor protein